MSSTRLPQSNSNDEGDASNRNARTRVCLTPVRNEAWILERFLRAASMWADVIIVLDQASDDGSKEIAAAFPKVHLADYPHQSYDDAIRRGVLVDLARDLVPGDRILIALDADEFIAADAWQQSEMRDFLGADPGTVALLRWVNVLPDEPRAWLAEGWTDFMFVDDGTAFRGEAMHGPRLPSGPRTRQVCLTGPKVLHLQYLDWERMKSKQRWYQAQERIEYPSKRPIQIYRQYHQMDAIASDERHALHPAWLAGYGPELAPRIVESEEHAAYPTDARVLDLIAEHGAPRFRRLDLWSTDWTRRASALGMTVADRAVADPNSRFDRLVLRWLAKTQNRALDKRIRWVQRALRVFGW